MTGRAGPGAGGRPVSNHYIGHSGKFCRLRRKRQRAAPAAGFARCRRGPERLTPARLQPERLGRLSGGGSPPARVSPAPASSSCPFASSGSATAPPAAAFVPSYRNRGGDRHENRARSVQKIGRKNRINSVVFAEINFRPFRNSDWRISTIIFGRTNYAVVPPADRRWLVSPAISSANPVVGRCGQPVDGADDGLRGLERFRSFQTSFVVLPPFRSWPAWRARRRS